MASQQFNGEKMKKLIIFGAGHNGRNLLKKFRQNSVDYYCDNDINKIGKEVYGIPIISFEHMVKIHYKFDIILSVDSEEMKEQLKVNNIKYYDNQSLTSYFMQEEVKQYIDDTLYEKYIFDKEFHYIAYKEKLDNWFREEYYKKPNKDIVEVMKLGVIENIDCYLDQLYVEDTFYSDEYYNNRPGMRLVRNILKNSEYIPQKTCICEFACGHGELLLKLYEDGFCVKGIEKNKNRVEHVKAKGIDCVEGTVEKTPFPDNSFDVIICQECLEHVFNPITVVKEMKRVLNKGGVVFCTTPYGKYCEDEMHVRQFDESKLYSLFVLNGFRIVNIIRIPYINSSGDDNLFIAAELD